MNKKLLRRNVLKELGATVAEVNGVYATLRNYLVQLRFPIQEGISATDRYKAVINAGRELAEGEEGLYLEKPEC